MRAVRIRALNRMSVHRSRLARSWTHCHCVQWCADARPIRLPIIQDGVHQLDKFNLPVAPTMNVLIRINVSAERVYWRAESNNAVWMPNVYRSCIELFALVPQATKAIHILNVHQVRFIIHFQCSTIAPIYGNDNSIELNVAYLSAAPKHPASVIPVECYTDDDCPYDRTCKNERCVNPCLQNTCGRGAFCHAEAHRAICKCPNGYTGSPLISCVPRKYLRFCSMTWRTILSVSGKTFQYSHDFFPLI